MHKPETGAAHSRVRRFYVAALTVLIFGLFAPAALPQVFQGKQSASDISTVAIDQILSILTEKARRSPAQQKMDSQLLQALAESRNEVFAPGVNLEPSGIKTVAGDVEIDIDVLGGQDVDSIVARVVAMGGTIIYPSQEYATLRARVRLADTETIAGLPEVKFVKPAVQAATSANPGGTQLVKTMSSTRRPSFAMRAAMLRSQLQRQLAAMPHKAVPLSGSVNSQGDHAHRADDARTTYGVDGSGVRIGVLSDSYNATGGAAADVTSGNLPGTGNPSGHTTPVMVLADYSQGTDEGRAMLQIVHDLAPGAQLYFATADLGEASFASNITALRNAPNNCDIIIDDVFYYDESPFQDGIIAQAVNTVTAGGALYFSSAGNEGSVAKGTAGYYEGDFNSTGSPAFTFPGGAKAGTIHNFGTVASPVNGNIIIAKGFVYNLNWSDPLSASTNDYDLFLVSSSGAVKLQSTTTQNGSQPPYESITPPALVTGDRLVVFKSNAAAVRAFALNTLRGRLTVTTTGQTHGHSAAVDAFSVGAASAAAVAPGVFSASSAVESFSADGPRRVFYLANGTAITPGNILFGTNGGSVRNKPDITAADGVATTLPGSSGLNPFYGTSAAAPHAGAIAALLRSANASLTAAQIRTILTTTMLDVEAAGYDNISGNGIIQAFQAMQAAVPAGGNCGVKGASTITLPQPAASGLPSNGNWVHKQRPDGESWIYTFEVAPHTTSASPSDLAGATGGGRPSDPAPTVQNTGGITAGTLGDGSVPAMDPGEPLQSRFVDESDYARLQLNTLEAIAGAEAEHGTSAALAGTAAHVRRLIGTVGLSDQLTAFEAVPPIDFNLEVPSVRVFLKLTHPNLNQVEISIANDSRRLVLWNGRDGGVQSGSTLIIDRVLSDELGQAPSGAWRLYIEDPSRTTGGELQEAWIAISTIPRTVADTSIQATLDIAATRSYFKTAGSNGGTEVPTPTIGQTVFLYGDYQVTGSGSAVTVTQRALLDGTLYCSGSLSGSPGFSYWVACNTGWTATSGAHTLRWDFDYLNAVSETNESNNSITNTFTPAGLDIAALRSYFKTASANGGTEIDPPAVGQTVYLYGDYQVTGSGSAVTVTQRALLDGTLYCSGSLSGSPGLGYWVGCNTGWVATTGSHTLRWDLDYTNTVPETNENNNSVTKTFTSAGLDIAAVRAYLKTASNNGGVEIDPPAVGQTVYFYGDYQVTGSGSAVTVTQRALFDGATYCTGSLSGSPGFSYWVGCITGWTAVAGSHTLRWDFDYNNAVPESNENNNSVSKTITPAGNSLDIVAQRAYFRTAASGGGTEVSTPAVGQSLYMHADYQLTGSGNAVSVTERALMDGTVFCSCANSATPGQSYSTWCSQAWTATSGAHTLRWDFDYNNSVAETNENNNSASMTFTSAGDTIAPSTSITTPANGATVSGTVPVSATASDNIGVTSLEIDIDGVQKASNTNATSLSYSWNTTQVTNGQHSIVSKAADAAGHITTSSTVTVTVANGLAAPANLIAIASSTSQVTVTWNAVASAASYQVFRSSGNSSFAIAGTSVTPSFTNSGLAPNTTYLYQVRAVDSSNVAWGPSDVDPATTIIFTDDPIVAMSTRIKAAHVTQLRTAVNAVRAAAGLTAASFTDAISTGTVVRAAQILELRLRLDEARAARALPAITYINAITAATSRIKAIDLTELRNGVK
jgi:hypothetical protein